MIIIHFTPRYEVSIRGHVVYHFHKMLDSSDRNWLCRLFKIPLDRLVVRLNGGMKLIEDTDLPF